MAGYPSRPIQSSSNSQWAKPRSAGTVTLPPWPFNVAHRVKRARCPFSGVQVPGDAAHDAGDVVFEIVAAQGVVE